MLTNRHLIDLAERPGLWATLCMPLEGGGPLAKGDPIRFRNLVRQAGDLLDARGDRAVRDAILERLDAVYRDHDVFNAGGRGLVVFASPHQAEHWHMPVPLAEAVRVGERPFLEPLIPIVTDPVHFYVVALSLHDVRLLECSRFVARRLPLPEGTPARLEDAAGWEVRQDSLQYHDPHSGPLLATARTRKFRTPSGNMGNRPIFHGQGGGKDDADADLEKYVRELDKGLWKAITHRGSPVVLAASEQLEPIYREHTRLPSLVEPFLHGNFERASDEELHALALELIEPRFAERIEQAKGRLCDLLGTGVATSELEQVVVAAADGKIDTLFLREGAHVPGSFDPETHRVMVGDGRATDLLDRAATDTFLAGGTVYRLDPSHMPVDSEAAAILRY